MIKLPGTVSRLVTWLNDHHIPVRLIVSVIAGIFTSMVLSIATHEILYLAGVFPPINKPMHETPLVVAELIYHSLYAIAGACITAHVAKEKAGKAVFVLGTKEAIMWVLGTILLWHHNPPWYNITKALLGIPLALLGGKLYQWYKAKKTQGHTAQPVIKTL